MFLLGLLLVASSTKSTYFSDFCLFIQNPNVYRRQGLFELND